MIAAWRLSRSITRCEKVEEASSRKVSTRSRPVVWLAKGAAVFMAAILYTRQGTLRCRAARPDSALGKYSAVRLRLCTGEASVTAAGSSV